MTPDDHADLHVLQVGVPGELVEQAAQHDRIRELDRVVDRLVARCQQLGPGYRHRLTLLIPGQKPASLKMAPT